MSVREEKVRELIRTVAADYLSSESNRQSLITVTDVKLSPDFRRATVFFTVFPEDKTEMALEFAKRKRSDFREFSRKKLLLRVLPVFDFAIDQGEKNRQKIDELMEDA